MSVNAEEYLDMKSPSLLSLFWTFLKIGSTAFGGFMALISVVQNYLVDREKLLTNEEMLDGISLATVLPGPVAVNVVAYAGYKIRGVSGAIVCATAVILPSFFLILFLSYAYFTWGDIPAVTSIFQGFLPAVAAIIAAAAINMGKKALSGFTEVSIAVAALFIIVFIGGFYSTLAVIFSAGSLGWILFRKDENVDESKVNKASLVEPGHRIRYLMLLAGGAVIAIAVPLVKLQSVLSVQVLLASKLFVTFAGMSVLLFGGGFVFIPLMQESIVEGYQWVTHKEFIDAIAMGQITPGPILISATFIGYKVAGVLGATLATIGIFAPPAVIMLICTHYLQALKTSLNIKAILKGVRCGVIGMIAAASYVVAMSAEINLITIAIFIFAMFALLKLKLEVIWIIPVSGIVGLLAFS